MKAALNRHLLFFPDACAPYLSDGSNSLQQRNSSNLANVSWVLCSTCSAHSRCDEQPEAKVSEGTDDIDNENLRARSSWSP
mmetsp:Transcript_12943/g.45508  ORF Transcript_12943/g.45508 Transcript_12943/m.45508 type:complete len:81 (-) Transcript_12943:978-1220(-)